MQELITEIAIYLGLAAFLGLVLGYLIWGLGQRRRIEVARAEAAAGARTTVDGNSPLRSRVESLTRERDRLEHRVEQLSARVASLLESGKEAEGSEIEERLGTVRMRMTDEPDDPMQRAAEAFPRPADAEPPDQSIFAPEGAREPDPEPDGTAPEKPARPWHGDGGPGEKAADESGSGEGPGPDGPAADTASQGLGAAADALRESLGQGSDRPTGDIASAAATPETGEDAAAGDRPAFLLSSAPDAPDDLTRIKGIGKSTEKALNAKGIWLFRQLAGMSGQDAEWISAAINAMPGRIAREGWSDQARALMEENSNDD